MRPIKTLIASALACLLVASFIGCTKPDEIDTRVAATVNGVDVFEADITLTIESSRIDQTTGEPMDDVAWANLLKENKYTPETLREYIIRNQFALYPLILQKASEAGITPDAAEIDQMLEDARTSVEGSGGTWTDYFRSMGFASEASYRQAYEAYKIYPQLMELQVKDAAPTQTEIDTYVSENASAYAGKRVSVIYLPFDAPAATDENEPTDEAGAGNEAGAGDESGNETTGDDADAASESTADAVRATAEEALAKLRAGTDFAEVAAEYSQLSSAADDGGDFGWGGEQQLPQNARDILDSLPVNEVSDVIEINLGTDDAPQYAFIIAKWTDEFDVPEDQIGQPVELSTIPAEVVEILTEAYAEQVKTEAQENYHTSLVNSTEIVVNPMPEGLSYAVDMSLADTEEDGDTTIPDAENTALKPETAPEPIFDENGLGISDITEGTGAEAQEGDTVLVNYSGYFEGGGRFDSSTYEVVIGQTSVIQGWHLGLVGMKVGGKRQLTIPPELAYGAAGQGTIPPNATLIFDIELVSLNGDTTGSNGAG